MKYFLTLWLVLAGAAAFYFNDELQLFFKSKLLLPPRDAYYTALLREDLIEIAEQWRLAAAESLTAPLQISLPYTERNLLEAAHLQPITFAFTRQIDQLIQVDISPSVNTRAEIFVDVFYLENAEAKPLRVESLAAGKSQLTIVVEHVGQYLVRVQPSYDARGLVDLTITSPLRYGFPVDTERSNTVQSLFGVERDGGTRRHEGIDIFAPRGTPVIAAAEGLVSRVGNTPRGGKNVWVRADGRSFYYAHLDSIAVTTGQRVARGQVLGTVGNTGNAIFTNPHLHFGIYKFGQGAVDPLPLVGRKKSVATYTPPKVNLAPRWLTITTEKTNLHSSPSTKASIVATVIRSELIKINAVTADWLRVTTGEGIQGFIPRKLTRPPTESQLTLTENYIAFQSPDHSSPVLGNFPAGEKLPILGRFGEFIWIKTPGGVEAWGQMEKQKSPASN